MGEDASLVHLGNGPSAMATLRDLALTLLHRAGFRSIASRLRYHSLHPEDAVALLVPTLPRTHKPCWATSLCLRHPSPVRGRGPTRTILRTGPSPEGRGMAKPG